MNKPTPHPEHHQSWCSLAATATVVGLAIVGLLLSECAGAEATNSTAWSVKEDADWRPADASATAVVPGSALDLSRLIEGPAGKDGRVVLSESGPLVFEKSVEDCHSFL
jgi:hypothetical protein